MYEKIPFAIKQTGLFFESGGGKLRDNQVRDILLNWGMQDAVVLKQYETQGGRIVCKVQTHAGLVILKGQPIAVPKEQIISDISAYEFLGNRRRMAPKVYYRPGGTALWEDGAYRYCVMEFIDGRQAEETAEDERLLGMATAALHKLTGYARPCLFHVGENLRQFQTWYADRPWKAEFDALLRQMPNFDQYRQCFIHTDIRPANVIIRDGSAIFIDLDGAGCGSPFLDLGWPFLSQFVEYDKKTKELGYKFELADAYLEGYCREYKLNRTEYDLLWWGAIYTHIYNMQWYGPDDVEPLWRILTFGIAQKDALLQIASYIK